MNGRDRFLIALKNGKPDRLPCQVHNWMQYYLNTYLKGMDVYQAYEYFGMDPVIYTFPNLIFDEKDLKNWAYEYKSLGVDKDGVESFIQTYHTPEGDLTVKGARNQFTSWETEHMIKNEDDFDNISASTKERIKEFECIKENLDENEKNESIDKVNEIVTSAT